MSLISDRREIFGAAKRGWPGNLALSSIVVPGTNYGTFPLTCLKTNNFDRPVIIWPLALATGAPSVTSHLWAIPVPLDDVSVGVNVTVTATDNTSQVPAIRSVNSGQLYLPNGGTWHIWTAQPTDVPCLVIDASDDVLAAMMLMIAGNHGIGYNAEVAVDVTNVLGCPANRMRKALFVQNTGTQNIRIMPVSPPSGTRGMLLRPNEPPIIFAGSTLFNGALRCTRDAGAAADSVIYALEFV